MAHPDTSWRVAAIHRCCVRYGMTKETATAHLRELGAESLASIWFRDNERHLNNCREGLI